MKEINLAQCPLLTAHIVVFDGNWNALSRSRWNVVPPVGAQYTLSCHNSILHSPLTPPPSFLSSPTHTPFWPAAVIYLYPSSPGYYQKLRCFQCVSLYIQIMKRRRCISRGCVPSALGVWVTSKTRQCLRQHCTHSHGFILLSIKRMRAFIMLYQRQSTPIITFPNIWMFYYPMCSFTIHYSAATLASVVYKYLRGFYF